MSETNDPTKAAIFALQRSADAALKQGEYRRAEIDGMRELAIWRRLDDLEGAIDALQRLADTFRARNRLHRVIECADERLSWCLRYKHSREIALAFRNLGLLMVEVNQLDRAASYLTRAKDILDAQPDVPPVHRAELLVQLGRIDWMTGAEPTARRRFSQALALLSDVDEDTASRMRSLLATPIGTPLSTLAIDGVADLVTRTAKHSEDKSQ